MLEQIESDGEAQMLNQLIHGLSPTGQREALTEANGRASEWFYDELYRLEEERLSDPLYGNRTTGYDNTGNRLTQTVSQTGTLRTGRPATRTTAMTGC